MPTAEKKDYYKTLGVKRSATTDDIRKAYRRLARKYHPDVNPGDKTAEEKFKEIQEAYGILNDEKKRQVYDQFGFYSPSFAGAAGARPGGGPGGGGRPSDFDFSGFDFSEFSRRAASSGSGAGAGAGSSGSFGGFSDLFSQFFRSNERSQKQQQSSPGEDLEYAVDIGFWDAIRGSTARISVFRHEACDTCHGSGAAGGGASTCPECKGAGQVNQTVGAMRFNLTCPRCGGRGSLENSCPTCGGDGRLGRNETVEVRIPPGAQDGSRLRVPKKGNAGVMGGPSGDLYIITRVGRHPLFERVGDDIRIKVPITYSEAILGGKIEVPTIDGKALLKIPPATSSGKTFRLREKGVLNRRTQQRGDQFVEVQITTPEIPDEETKSLARKLAELNPDDPRKALFEGV